MLFEQQDRSRGAAGAARRIRGVLLIFGPVVAIIALIGVFYVPLAYRNFWPPYDRAICVSDTDREAARASFDRGNSMFTLRSGSDAETLVHPKRGTGDWHCRRS